ncbi:hypothetical protein GCM10008955_01200 [Deinococcus malanensis]|uniref:Uncharacterized protein n=1 Tax=Deinococcus malanensis TaxID=1706855 RepID=A0ABQ2EJE4_9DEIO|nr:hypothetical protein [Deinococcus malanensis]GGK11725.1 hypothetical protein GCM10008955_01200 [Deinococcus malanensis]
MNTAQALQALFPTLDPVRYIHEERPKPMPQDAFFVISNLSDGETGRFYPRADGHKAQQRELIVLVTLFGREGWKLADLKPWFVPLRSRLADLVTEHPGYPPLRGVNRGLVIPPTSDSDTRRPLASVRLICKYIQ